MVRIINMTIVGENAKYIEAAGLSTDDKPTANVATGSLVMEVDTGDIYAYDEAGTQWCKVTELGGGD